MLTVEQSTNICEGILALTSVYLVFKCIEVKKNNQKDTLALARSYGYKV